MTAAVLGSAALPDLAKASAANPQSVNLPYNPATSDAMPTRNLGKTGYKVGIFSLGDKLRWRRRTTKRPRFPSSKRLSISA